MPHHQVSAPSLRAFMTHVFERLGYPSDQAADAAGVLLWASLRGVDTHGIRNLKPYYVDRTLTGMLRPDASIRVERETPYSACLDGDSGLGLACACQAMRLAVAKAQQAGVGMVCVRNAHHLGPAGYFAHMAVEQGMLGMCMTGHFFGEGHSIGVAPLGSAVPMFSTNPLSFAAPCGRHPPFLLDMSTAVVTVNRIEMYGQEGLAIPIGWARDAAGKPTTDPTAARVLLPLGGTPELGGYKGIGLTMMATILSGVLSGAWSAVQQAEESGVDHDVSTVGVFNQPTMGHWFMAIKIAPFQPLDQFRRAMDAMIDSLHATPMLDSSRDATTYPGELESITSRERQQNGIPLDERTWRELCSISMKLQVDMPA